jgi:hypothetical protein
MGSFMRKVGRRASIPANISELRRRMQESSDISEVFVYFDDHLGRSDDFNRLGSRVPNEPLVGVARSIIKVALSMSVAPLHPLTFIAEHNLWHGTLLSQEGMALVIYFADIDRGCCCVMRYGAKRTDFLRFSIPEGAGDGIDPDSAKLESIARRSPGGKSN